MVVVVNIVAKGSFACSCESENLVQIRETGRAMPRMSVNEVGDFTVENLPLELEFGVTFTQSLFR